ncbi:hypothetical protein OA105_01955 [Prochlorococcus sp. AH-736-B08]|nr:hypothetical protein [Prochlorococcus sp. AH-736-B08]
MKRLLLLLIAALAIPTAVNSAFIQKEENPMTDEKSLMIMEQSSNSVDNSIGISEKGTFVIGCIDMAGQNKTMLAFMTPTYNSSDPQDILVRFDKKDAKKMLWVGNKGGNGFILPVSSSDEFINNILSHSKLALQWETYPNSIKKYLIFDLDGLKKEIANGKEEGCNFNF